MSSNESIGGSWKEQVMAGMTYRAFCCSFPTILLIPYAFTGLPMLLPINQLLTPYLRYCNGMDTPCGHGVSIPLIGSSYSVFMPQADPGYRVFL